MKSYNNMFFEIVRPRNLYKAAKDQIKRHNKKVDAQRWQRTLIFRLTILHNVLKEGNYVTPDYKVFYIKDPKERTIMCLPFTCRIVHEAMLIQLRPILLPMFNRDSYACIKGRGQHLLLKNLKDDLNRDPIGTKYCWKGDVYHYYDEIDQDILLNILFRKIRCTKTREMLFELIRSTKKGVPIGNQPSQEFGILYLSALDHFMKRVVRIKYYYRYADDIVMLAPSKKDLHHTAWRLMNFAHYERKLFFKKRQIFKVDDRSIDYVGYRFFHDKVIMRKAIKKDLCREVAKLRKKGMTDREIRLKTASRAGWAKHADVKQLMHRLNIMEQKKKINADDYSDFTEIKVTPDLFREQPVVLCGIRKKKSKYPDKKPDYYYHVKVKFQEKHYVVACYNEGDICLLEAIKEEDAFPVEMLFRRIEHKTDKAKYLIKNVD